MNADRRTKLASLIERLSDLNDEVMTLATDERDAYDNLPENLQTNHSGEGNADCLDEASELIASAITQLQEADA